MESAEQKAISYLKSHYEKVREYVSPSPYLFDYADEKFYHSMQVIGAMKYIMKHEKTFQNRDENFMNFAKIATILHDIGRFEEIKQRFKETTSHNKLSHGYLGAEILRNSAEYNDPRIYIPVRHHSGLAQDLYNDEEYKNINDEGLKEEISEIIKLVRDADKTANFYLFTSSGVKRLPHLFPRAQVKNKKLYELSENTKKIIKEHRLMKFSEINSELDDRICYLLWVFDINYQSSYDLIIRNGSFKRLMENVFTYCAKQEDKNFIKTEVEIYFKSGLR